MDRVNAGLFDSGRAPNRELPSSSGTRETLPFAIDERRVGATPARGIEHPLAPMNFAFLNGAWLPGSGDEHDPSAGAGIRAGFSCSVGRR